MLRAVKTPEKKSTRPTTARKWSDALRIKMFRRLVPARTAQSSEIEVKLAETTEERAAAFRLLHDEYVRSGLADADASGMRVTRYHLLPTTRVVIAKDGDTVVGTLSLIERTALGVPAEAIFDLSPACRFGGVVEETSSLAVSHAASDDGTILFAIIKFAVRHSRSRGVHHWVLTCHPRHRHLYEEILGFEPLAERAVKSYDFVKGAPAVGSYVNLQTLPHALAKTYGTDTPRTPYRFIFGDQRDGFERGANGGAASVA